MRNSTFSHPRQGEARSVRRWSRSSIPAAGNAAGPDQQRRHLGNPTTSFPDDLDGSVSSQRVRIRRQRGEQHRLEPGAAWRRPAASPSAPCVSFPVRACSAAGGQILVANMAPFVICSS
jgi:hypothetical protein